MSNSLMYQEDYFVIIQTDLPEEILTKQELLEKLQKVLEEFSGVMPPELVKFTTLEEKALFLQNNFCEWKTQPGEYLQWYATRISK